MPVDVFLGIFKLPRNPSASACELLLAGRDEQEC